MSQATETNLTLDLDWEGPEDERVTVARVCVNHSNAVTRDGSRVTISQNCTSFRALEKELARLSDELDEISAQAHEHFEGARPESKRKAAATMRFDSSTATSAANHNTLTAHLEQCLDDVAELDARA